MAQKPEGWNSGLDEDQGTLGSPFVEKFVPANIAQSIVEL